MYCVRFWGWKEGNIWVIGVIFADELKILKLLDMSFWSWIGDFFLFKWLFGSHKHHDSAESGQDLLSDRHADPADDYDDVLDDIYNSYDDFDESDVSDSFDSYDDFDELDDFDMMDDDF